MKHVENLLSLYSRRPSPNILSFARPTAQVSPTPLCLSSTTSPPATLPPAVPNVPLSKLTTTDHGLDRNQLTKMTNGQSLHEIKGQKTPETPLPIVMPLTN